jgi:hypothetical protein
VPLKNAQEYHETKMKMMSKEKEAMNENAGLLVH